jgi:tape measure domain-containing protein
MANVGYATLQVIPSLRGMESVVQRQLSGKMAGIGSAAGAAAGRSLSARLASSAISGLDTFGAKITSTVGGALRKGLLVGGGALAGVAGFSLFGGLNRLLDTEDARVQLDRMGLSVKEIDDLLAGVDRTFQGTPFANPDGFNIASQLFASGRALGEIPGILGNIADLAAHGNVPIDQMGSLFTRIASQGRVTGEELNRLSDANIPLSVLADEMGITVGELRKMASEGKLTADVFFDAVEGVEMFDGAAKAAGDTTRGAFSNVMTALKRLGADFLAPLFGVNGFAVQGLKTVLEWLKSLSPAIKDLGQRFADWLIPAVQTATAWFRDSLVPALQRVVELVRTGIGWFREHSDAIRKIVAAVIPAAAAVAGLATGIHLVNVALKLATTGNVWIFLLTLLATALVYAWQNSERFREVVTNAFQKVREVVGPIIETVSGWIRGLFGGDGTSGAAGATSRIAEAWQKIRKVAAEVWPKVREHIATAIEWVRTNVLPVVRDVAAGAIKAFDALVGWVIDNWPEIRRVIGDVVDWFKIHVGPVIVAAVQLVLAIWDRLVQAAPIVAGFIRDVWEKHGEEILSALSTAWDFIRTTIEVALRIIRGVIETITKLIEGDWSGAWAAIKQTAIDAWHAIAPGLRTFWDNTLLPFIKSIPGLILEGLGALGGLLLDAGKALLNGLWQGIQAVWDDPILPFIKSLPGLALAGLGELGSFLLQKGQDLLGGLWDGITGLWEGTVLPFFQKLGSTIAGGVGNLINTLKVKGSALLSGFWNGMTALWTTISDRFKNLGRTIATWVGDLINTLRTKGSALLSGFWNGMVNLWSNIRDRFVTLGSTIAGWVGDLVNTLRNKGAALLSGFWNGMVNLWASIRTRFTTLASTVLGWVGDLARTLYLKGWNLVGGLWNGIKDFWNTIVKPFFTGLPTTILNAVGSLALTLWQRGRDLVGGFVSGMNSWAGSIGQSVKDALIGFTNWLIDKVNATVNLLDVALGPFINLPSVPHINTPSTSRRGGGGSVGGPLPPGVALHSGGVVPGFAGQESWHLLEAGEAVLNRMQQAHLTAMLGIGRTGTRSTGGLHVENLNVGDRRDADEMVGALGGLEWRLRVGAG